MDVRRSTNRATTSTAQKSVPLMQLRIEVIKLQLLPYLDNSDRRNLFNSCRYLRPLKQTEFIYKFSTDASLKYATNARFRKRVHQSAAVNQQRLNKRMIDINLRGNKHITDVSMLGDVMALNLSCCEVVDVSALGEGQMLDLNYCKKIDIAGADALIRHLLAVLSTNITDDATAAIVQRIAYAKQCAAFTLARIADEDHRGHQNLVAAEGGISSLLAIVINDEAHRSSVELKIHAVEALGNVAHGNGANQQLIAAGGGITALIAMLTDDSKDSSETLRKTSAHALARIAYLDQINTNHIITALISELYCGTSSDRCISAGVQESVIFAVDRLLDSNRDNKNLIAEKGGITSLIAVLKNDSSDHGSANLKLLAAELLNSLATDNKPILQLIVDGGGITVLLAALRDFSNLSNVRVKMGAAKVLAHLSFADVRIKQMIVDEGGIKALVAALKIHTSNNLTQGLQHFVSSALTGLAFGSDHRKQLIIDAGGIPALVAVLSRNTYGGHDTMAKDCASRTLRVLATDSYINRQLIAEAGGIYALVAVARDVHHLCHFVSAQRALQELAKNANLERLIQSIGGGELMLEYPY